MKAVILAAGMGKRLAATGWDKPKCLLPFGGHTLLDHTLAALAAVDVTDLVVVVGYKHQLVRDAVAAHGVRAAFVTNADYAETNTIHSLHLAREHLSGDFLYFNADVLFDSRILPLLLGTDDSTMAVDVGACGQEDVKVIVDGDNRILRIGKDLAIEECQGEFIGIAKFAAGVCEDFIASLARYNEQLARRDLFFESAVDPILATHVHRSVPLGKLAAVEIDSPDDLAAARKLWDAGQIQSAVGTGAPEAAGKEHHEHRQ